MTPDLTEDEIQARLAGEAVAGPRTFRGRTLAPLSRGLRDLRNKVVAPDDTDIFHDCALLHLLAEAHAADDSQRIAKRRALIAVTDDVPTFRAAVSLVIDDYSDADLLEARRLTNEILGIVEQAEVALKKSPAAEPLAVVEPSRMTTPSPSSPLPAIPAGAPSTSAGN